MLKRCNVSLMNEKWEILIPNFKIKYLPRFGELIYLNDKEQYYKIINIIHNITNKHEIFIIVEKYN